MTPEHRALLGALLPHAPGAVAVLRCLVENADRVEETADRLAALSGTTIASAAAVQSAVRTWREAKAEETRAPDREDLLELTSTLEGFAAGYELRRSQEPEILAILTVPAGSSLEAALAHSARPAPRYETRDGFRHLAQRAARRLTILTPFLDDKGAEYLISLAQQTKAQDKTIILRPKNNGERPWARFCPALRSSGLRVLEYWIDPAEPIDLGPMSAETFHAKLAIADSELAYLGSSNLQSSSLDFGLECGAILSGQAAAPFVRVVEAVVGLSVDAPRC